MATQQELEQIRALLSEETTIEELEFEKHSQKLIATLIAEYENEPTRLLLRMYREGHERLDYSIYADDRQFYLHRAAMKAVLDTREHIPSKKEAKELRRLRAKQNHGRGKSRNR